MFAADFHNGTLRSGENGRTKAMYSNVGEPQKHALEQKRKTKGYVWCEPIYINLLMTHKTKLGIVYGEPIGSKVESHAWERSVPSYMSMVSHHAPHSPGSLGLTVCPMYE